MKILHLIEDHQVVERSLQMFEKLFPASNSVIVFSQSNTYKYLKELSSSPNVNKNNLSEVASKIDFNQYDYVMIHYLSMIKIDFVKYIPRKIPLIWSIYGGDLYNQFADVIGLNIYYKSPRNYVNFSRIRRMIPSPIEKLFLFFIKRDENIFTFVRKKKFSYILNRIDVLSGEKCDIKIIEKYSGKKYRSFQVGVYPLKQTLGQLYNNPFSKGKNVMLGNSASFTNNHLYALEFLKTFAFPEGTVISLTLSYGRNEKYVKEVKKSFRHYLGDYVKFEESYLPLEVYNKKFLEYQIMIMPAWRQESVGTLIMGFYFGIKVYMSSKNPLYNTMKEIGFVLYKLEDVTERSFFVELSDDIKQYNRHLCEKISSTESIEKNILDFFENG